MIPNILFSLPIGVLAGFSVVTVFNRLPARWLCDYGEDPCEELISGKERIKNYPWKAVFSVLFICTALLLTTMSGLLYALLTLAVLWLLLEISIVDIKYMIIPDQFVILLAFLSIAFIPYHNSLLSPLYGAAIGAGCMFVIGALGKLMYKKEALGFGDIKLFSAVGLITGPFGISLILIAASLLSAAVFTVGLVTKKIKRTDVFPLGPYIALSTVIYLIDIRVYTC